MGIEEGLGVSFGFAKQAGMAAVMVEGANPFLDETLGRFGEASVFALEFGEGGFEAGNFGFLFEEGGVGGFAGEALDDGGDEALGSDGGVHGVMRKVAMMRALGFLWPAALARRMRCRRKAALGRVRVRVTAWSFLGLRGRPRRRLPRDLETLRRGEGERLGGMSFRFQVSGWRGGGRGL